MKVAVSFFKYPSGYMTFLKKKVNRQAEKLEC